MSDKQEVSILDAKNPLSGVLIEGKIHDSHTVIQLTQTFKNDESVPIEAVYAFPVPEDCCVTNLSIEIDNRLIQMQVQEKEVASNKYSDSIAEGKSAILMEYGSLDSYRINIGRLNPGSYCRAKLEYLTNLKQVGPNKQRLCISTKIADLYSLTSGDHLSSVSKSFGKNLDISLEGSVSNNLVDIEAISTNHRYLINKTLKDWTAVANGVNSDKDIIFEISTEKDETLKDGKLALESYSTGFENQFSARLSFTPSAGQGEEFPHRTDDTEYIFLIDCSGSMDGERIDRARSAVKIALQSLPFGSAVNVMRFGSSFERLFDSARSIDQDCSNKVKKYIDETRANLGGTEIEKPIEDIIYNQARSRAERIIFLLTDGEVTENKTFFSKLRRNPDPQTRVFSIGIGLTGGKGFLRNISIVTGGLEEYIQQESDISRVVISQVRRAVFPRISDLKVSSPFFTRIIRPDNVISNSINHVYLLENTTNSLDVDSVITLEYTVSNSVVRKEFPLKDVVIKNDSIIHKWAEKKSIDNLIDHYDTLDEDHQVEKDTLKHVIVKKSVESSILNPFTSFIGVERNLGDQNLLNNLETMQLRVIDAEFTTGGSDYIPKSRCLYSSNLKCASPSNSRSRGPPAKKSKIDNHHSAQESGRACSRSQSDVSEEVFNKVMNLQQADGLWKKSKKLLTMMEVTDDDYKQLCSEFGLDEEYMPTIVVMEWLKKKHSKKEDIWGLAIKKAYHVLATL
jgi:hypothetical protein